MIDRNLVMKLAEEHVAGKEIFLVDVKVSTGNRITVLANKMGGITIDECVALSRHIEGNLDRENEDFELQVSSPGLDSPFLVREQYEMNLGRKVEVTPRDGKKIKGILKSLTDNGFEIEVEGREKGIKKEPVAHSFGFDEIRSVKVVITFKN
ncbi:MAG: ribosome assembly cofactor RimP [Bacteroidales bacterium]